MGTENTQETATLALIELLVVSRLTLEDLRALCNAQAIAYSMVDDKSDLWELLKAWAWGKAE